ncbi:MAG: succinate dehydrogenase assembly factor 2 [Gammaproteobacteria bacterium]|nr:succinate dehydrogenase assembly factor 2 [Gammaproteobacteria bacterium]
MQKSRLRWMCRRGMKELDVVMGRYLDSRYASANEDEKQGFITLLEMPDPDLYSLLMGRQTSPDQNADKVARSIRNMAGR